MKTQFANYKLGQLSINSYRFAGALETDVEDIIRSVETESEETLVATLETDEEVKALESLMSRL